MYSCLAQLIDACRHSQPVTADLIDKADAELKIVAKNRADFVERIAFLEQRDRDSERFCKEMLIRCAESIHVANTAMVVDWESPSQPAQTEAVAEFLRTLAGYVAHARKS